MSASVDLLQRYIQEGLIIQFGRFKGENDQFSPLSTNFLLLPSYPALMHDTAKALVPLLQESDSDRLLTTRAAIPLGAVLAVESGMPLTYPYGEAKAYTAAYVIEGAYDVGHPTTLLTYTLGSDEDALDLMEPARKVGLTVQQVISVLQVGEGGAGALQSQGIAVHSLYNLADTLPDLVSKGVLPAPMQAQISAWLAS